MRDLNVPVVIIGFNRPDVLEQLFQVLRIAAPKKVFVIADGPREDVPEDIENCAKVIELFRSIDWTDDVTEIFSDTNMGCNHRIPTGITEVMRHVDRAIILEDDCIPHISFFKFCEEMLTTYENDERIMHITGSNFQANRPTSAFSYYFSRYALCWGWATWRRAWDKFSFGMPYWEGLKDDGWLNYYINDHEEVKFWTQLYDTMHSGVDLWDHQWNYITWMQSAYSIVPNGNLISNIGYQNEAQHDTNMFPTLGLPTHPIKFPLEHPPHMIRNFCADNLWGRRLKSPSRKYIW